ncbi:hypothetical protein C8R41DRAFT_810959 [Lentinula lateritia]|uniref:Uncharacterized protein n=1 Tax=Lentinula lateritia TaxID=40482 RepID=A0ABQ8VXS8_9AGAR|nr:hypothetical protein C8R41DRAFT_810959 [Lentinula lateritia]
MIISYLLVTSLSCWSQLHFLTYSQTIIYLLYVSITKVTVNFQRSVVFPQLSIQNDSEESGKACVTVYICTRKRPSDLPSPDRVDALLNIAFFAKHLHSLAHHHSRPSPSSDTI